MSALAWTAALARAVSVADVPTTAGRTFARLVATRPAFAGLAWDELDGGDALPAGRPAAPAAAPWPALVATAHAEPAEGVFRLVAPRPLMSGPAVERTPWLAHQRRSRIVLNLADAIGLGLADGDTATVRHEQGVHVGQVTTSRRLRRGTVRIDWRGIPTGAGARIEKGAAR